MKILLVLLMSYVVVSMSAGVCAMFLDMLTNRVPRIVIMLLMFPAMFVGMVSMGGLGVYLLWSMPW